MDRTTMLDLQTKADNGDAQAMYELSKAMRLVGERSYEQKIYYWLQRAADNGCVDAQFDYGMELAKTGQGECIDYLKKAAEAGHQTAIKLLQKMNMM